MGKSQEGRKFKSRVCVGGDDVRGCYDPILVVGLNVQKPIRPYPPLKKKTCQALNFRP